MIEYSYTRDYDLGLITGDLLRDTTNHCSEESPKEKEVAEQREPPEDTANDQRTGITTDSMPNPEPDESSEPVRVTKLSKKDKKKMKAAAAWDFPPLASRDGSVVNTASKSLLQMNAKVYAIAARYNITPLMRAALDKFKAQSEGSWDTRDLVAAIPVVFNQIADTETEMRHTLTATIIENAHILLSDPEFSQAIEAVDGLAFELFRRVGSLARHQKVCRWCGSAFLSKCSSDGCGSQHFKMYNSGHSLVI